MTLMTAHRILIASAVAFFGFFAFWSATHPLPEGGLGWPVGSAAVAVGLAVYLASVWSRR